MRKYLKNIISAAALLSFSIMVFANSGPAFWQGYPASEVMSIEENSPISVKSEKLVFDFSNCDDPDFTISGKVMATYEMVNPTEELRPVRMVFPFVGTLRNFLRRI
ncbi:MAG TPA: hypothetical protein VEG39_21355 [Clostridia bacterium]|nr:hypothetical protein [Clostridia bacterium]